MQTDYLFNFAALILILSGFLMCKKRINLAGILIGVSGWACVIIAALMMGDQLFWASWFSFYLGFKIISNTERLLTLGKNHDKTKAKFEKFISSAAMSRPVNYVIMPLIIIIAGAGSTFMLKTNHLFLFVPFIVLIGMAVTFELILTHERSCINNPELRK